MENREYWDSLSDVELKEESREYKKLYANLESNYSDHLKVSEPFLGPRWTLGTRVYNICADKILNIVNREIKPRQKADTLEDALFEIKTKNTLFDFNFSFVDYYHERKWNQFAGLAHPSDFIIPSEKIIEDLQYWHNSITESLDKETESYGTDYSNPFVLLLLFELGAYDAIKERLEEINPDYKRNMSKVLSIILNRNEHTLRKYINHIGSERYNEFNPANKSTLKLIHNVLKKFGLTAQKVVEPKQK